MSQTQGDTAGSEGHSRATGGCDRGGDVGLADQCGDGENEDNGETGGKRSPADPEDWRVEVQLIT